MSVIAIHPRTALPGAASRTPEPRRRPASPGTATLRLTLEVPLADDRLSPQLALLLELARDLADQNAGTVAVTDVVPARPPEVVPERDTGYPARSVRRWEVDRTTAPDVVRRQDGTYGPDRAAVRDGDLGAGEAVARPELRVLTGSRVVLRDGLPVPFTRLEFDLLVFLARHPRRVFTRTQLLGSVWGYQHAVARTVDVHVRRLRAKVGDGVPVVTTVHGVGYRLADEALIRVVDDGAATVEL